MQGQVIQVAYKGLYPTCTIPAKFYGLPNIHKLVIPLRHIVSSRGSITYGVAKELANILGPMMEGFPIILGTCRFSIEQTKDIHLQHGECVSSYSVKALFTSLPVGSALNIIHCRLQQDPHFSNRNFLSILPHYCHLFTFRGKYYKQVPDSSMQYPISPLVANLFMEDFQARTISTTPNPPRIWLRYMDDNFVIHKAEHAKQFLSHLNFLNPTIQFTTEAPNKQGALPFLDTLVSTGPNGLLITSVYRKPTPMENIYNGTAIRASLHYAVYKTPLHTEPRPNAQTGSYLDRNNKT